MTAWRARDLFGSFAPRPAGAPDDGLDAAKIAAMGLMAASHTLLAFRDLAVAGYLIGRPCVPIFFFTLLCRLVDAPPDREQRMLMRLIVYGVIAQIPYSLLTQHGAPRANVLVTLALALLLVGLWRRGHLLPVALLLLLASALLDPYLDGGAIILTATLGGFIVFRTSPYLALTLVTSGALIDDALTGPVGLWSAVPALAAPLLLLASPMIKGVRLPQAAFYAFYPAHLLAIWLILGAYR